jgi:hypothetical protein
MAGSGERSGGTGQRATISTGAWLFGITRAVISLFFLFLGIAPILELFGVERERVAPDFGLSVGLILIGLIVFWLRSKFRALYGLIELGAALATMFIGIQTYQTQGANAAAYLQILGGLYIMIRGLDNIVASAPNRDWRQFFVKP